MTPPQKPVSGNPPQYQLRLNLEGPKPNLSIPFEEPATAAPEGEPSSIPMVTVRVAFPFSSSGKVSVHVGNQKIFETNRLKTKAWSTPPRAATSGSNPIAEGMKQFLNDVKEECSGIFQLFGF
ncbi:MAG: hypothetical protein K8R69_05885 [Deltaproteobacteria bacterium]|nr:hypothetical protein [Deltaproteobacteria bacterium]